MLQKQLKVLGGNIMCNTFLGLLFRSIGCSFVQISFYKIISLFLMFKYRIFFSYLKFKIIICILQEGESQIRDLFTVLLSRFHIRKHNKVPGCVSQRVILARFQDGGGCFRSQWEAAIVRLGEAIWSWQVSQFYHWGESTASKVTLWQVSPRCGLTSRKKVWRTHNSSQQGNHTK